MAEPKLGEESTTLAEETLTGVLKNNLVTFAVFIRAWYYCTMRGLGETSV